MALEIKRRRFINVNFTSLRKPLELLIILVLSLDLLVDKAREIGWQVVDPLDLLLGIVVQVVVHQVGGGHRVDSQRLVPVERIKPKGQKVEQLPSVGRPQVQILRNVEEEHKVIVVVLRKDDTAYVLNLVEAGLLVFAFSCQLVRIDVFSGLDVDSILLLRVVGSSHSSELLRPLSIHDVLVGGLELRFYLRRHDFVLRLDHTCFRIDY